jgi:hypothetical protein
MIKAEKIVNFDRVFQDFVFDAITDRVVDELKDVAEMLSVAAFGKKDPVLNKIREVIQIKIERYVTSQESRHQAQKSNNP